MNKESPKINLLVTADYELFLGRNFVSDDEVLFEPTKKMLEVCESHNIPITFYADICSVWAHQKYGLTDYARKFENQLIKANANGHDVQLHLHPHWINSTYDNGEWNISTDKMYLYEFGFNNGENSAQAIIKQGIDYLNDLLHATNRDYNCTSFRAAGLALQPNENKLIKALHQYGIKTDSSIAKGLIFNIDTIKVDYSKLPDNANWLISEEDGLAGYAKNGIYEIPIATFKSNLVQRIKFLSKRIKSIKMRRGAGISRSARQTRFSTLKTMINYNLRYILTNPYFSFSCDTKGFDLKMLTDGFDDYIARHSNVESITVSMINHPKLLFDPQLEMLCDLIKSLRSRYGDNINFVTASEAGKLIA